MRREQPGALKQTTDKTVSFPPQETVPAAPHGTETAGQGPKAGDISPAVEKNAEIPLARRSMDRPGSRIDRKAADEARTDGELTGAAETGAAGEPLSAVPPLLPPQTLQSTAPEPETDQPEPRVSAPIQPVPAVDLGQSLVAKAAARANLPMTARSAVLPATDSCARFCAIPARTWQCAASRATQRHLIIFTG